MRSFRAWTLSLMLAATCAAPSALAAPAIPPPVDHEAADADFNRYSLAPGTAFHVLLETPISTGVNQPGDPVDALLARDMYLNSDLLLSKSTRLKGEITRLEPPIQGRNAILEIRFTEILLDNGERLPLETHIRTEHPEHIWGGQVTEGTKPVLITQRVVDIGEYNRVMYRGPRRMGSHVAFAPGDHWVVILEKPLTLVLPRSAEEADSSRY